MMTTGRISTHHASRRKVLPHALTRRSTEDPAMGTPYVRNRLVAKRLFANRKFMAADPEDTQASPIYRHCLISLVHKSSPFRLQRLAISSSFSSAASKS